MTKDEMMLFFHSHPPICLKDLKAVPVDLIGAVFDGHGEDLNPVFHISCKCGSETAKVTGYFWKNTDYDHKEVEVFISPLTFTCATCGMKSIFFDSSKHGSDAMFSGLTPTVREKGNIGIFKCPECNDDNLKLFVRFEYSDEVFDDIPEFKNREQEAFSWFSLIGHCPKCSSKFDITDFECA